MTDEPAQKPSQTPNQRRPARTDADAGTPLDRARIDAADPSRKPDLLPVLYLVGFVVLAGTLFYLWQHPRASRLSVEQANQMDTLQAQVTGLRDDVARLSQQLGMVQNRAAATPASVQQLGDKLTALENRPAVTPGTVQQLADKLTALESRPAVMPGVVQQLSDQVTALDNRKVATPEQLSLLSEQIQTLGRQIPDLQPLTQRLAAVEQRPQFDPSAINGKIGGLSKDLSDLGAKIQQANTAEQDANGKLGTRLDQLASRTDDLDKQEKQQADQLRALTQKAQITARLQGMAASLAAGQKLGDIPGAPPALARFATEAPPTEAQLRESFDGYADAAQKASQPAITDNQDFGARLWTRAQQAVTVRQGDRVLVGDPIAGVIAHAREKLNNGDLAGAVAALKGLGGPAAQAMQPWTDKAQSLVAARAAIASLAAS